MYLSQTQQSPESSFFTGSRVGAALSMSNTKQLPNHSHLPHKTTTDVCLYQHLPSFDQKTDLMCQRQSHQLWSCVMCAKARDWVVIWHSSTEWSRLANGVQNTVIFSSLRQLPEERLGGVGFLFKTDLALSATTEREASFSLLCLHSRRDGTWLTALFHLLLLLKKRKRGHVCTVCDVLLCTFFLNFCSHDFYHR